MNHNSSLASIVTAFIAASAISHQDSLKSTYSVKESNTFPPARRISYHHSPLFNSDLRSLVKSNSHASLIGIILTQGALSARSKVICFFHFCILCSTTLTIDHEKTVSGFQTVLS